MRFLTLLISLNILIAQVYLSKIKVHKHIDVNDGLVQSQVTSLFQDSKGYIWIGTLGGLSKWDGINFQNFYTNDGLPAAQIMDIQETKNGDIYLAAYGGGVLRIYDEKIDTLNIDNGLSTNNITQIEILENGDILFFGNAGNISRLNNDTISNWGQKINFPKYDIWDVNISKNGTIYCATQMGLVTIRGDSITVLNSENGLLTDLIWSVNSKNDSTIYLGTNGGINKIVNGNITTLSLENQNFRSDKILISNEGDVYFSTNIGILIETDSALELISKNEGLASNDVWVLMQDKAGLIYAGTNGNGVSIYDPKEVIVNLTKNTGLNEERVISIAEDKLGNIFLGTKAGVYQFRNNRLNHFKKGTDIRENIIDVMHKSSAGDILFGTKKGLKKFTGNSIVDYIDNEEISNNEIFSIGENKNGDLFLGTPVGVYTIKNGVVDKIPFFDTMSSNYIMSILAIDNNQIYFGSFDMGLFYFDGKHYQNISVKDGLSDSRVTSMHQLQNGQVLVGTQNGLNIIDNSIIIDTINIDDGLSNNVVTGINETSEGQFIISTNKGINVIRNLFQEELKIRQIDNSDGLINDNCIIGASYLDSEGKLWIGTSKGVSIYDSKSDIPIKIPPKVYLTGLEIFNKKYPLSALERSNKLSYNQNYIKFFFSGINLTAPHKLIYEYKLIGVDDTWVSSKDNSIQYTSLDDGNYEFIVRAKNEWGILSEPAILSFVINPAWWETWWFRLIVVSLLGALLWAAFQYRLNYLLKLERLRTKIASDLHDEVGSALTQISINADSLSYIKDIEKVNKKSGFIRNKSNEVITMMSDVIWSIDSRNDNLESLIDRIHNFAQNFLDQTEIKLSFKTDITPGLKKTLKIDFRQNVMMIAKEVINNAVKYSGCSEIDISIKYQSGKFELKISDNGKGIDFDNVIYGNGLKNMKMRAESIKGKLELTNNPGLTVIFTK